MGIEKTTIESIAGSVDEAIEKGLLELGLQKDEVDVDVLDEGKRGLFKRMARVRLSVKSQKSAEPIESEIDPGLKANPEKDAENWLDNEVIDDDEALAVSRETVRELLEHMDIKAEIHAEYGDPDDRDEIPVFINIEGNDLSFLIGRHSETINALQYIASLIINKKLNRWIPLQLDVQNYRLRRERELRKLARRIGDQVATSGRKQFLEPMPANERRIIHMELRENPAVETESTGEEPYRKVIISPKK
jgi:spoIIIJ-associated protein